MFGQKLIDIGFSVFTKAGVDGDGFNGLTDGAVEDLELIGVESGLGESLKVNT